MKGQATFFCMMLMLALYVFVRGVSVLGSLEHKANLKQAAEIIVR